MPADPRTPTRSCGDRSKALPILGAVLALVAAQGAGCLGSGRTFLDNVGVQMGERGEISLVLCEASDGLAALTMTVEPSDREVEIERSTGASPKLEVSLTSVTPGYRVRGDLLGPDDSAITITSSEAAAGFPGMTQDSYDLSLLRPGFVLTADGDLVDSTTWAADNVDCWHN